MIALFIALFISLAIIIVTLTIVCWGFSLNENAVWLSFNSFRKFYDIAPEKYELRWDNIIYHAKSYHYQCINLKTPIDYARYWLLYKKKNRQKKNIDNVKRTQAYIDCVRKDLEKFTKENKHDI